MKCKKCHSQLKEDKKAKCIQSQYYCKKCEVFMLLPEQMEKGE